MNKTLSLMIAAAALVGGAVPAVADTAQAPAAAASAPALHRVQGFRSATFGMDEAQVKAAIAADFKPAGGALQAFDNPVEKTHAIALHLASLAPAPGAADITYIFGATSHRLMHVNVVWSTGPAPTSTERLEMATAGTELAGYFRDLGWRRGATTSSAAADGSYAVLFAGIDPADAGVELRLSGVEIRRANQAPTVPTGPAVLHVAYYANVGKPDTGSAVVRGTF